MTAPAKAAPKTPPQAKAKVKVKAIAAEPFMRFTIRTVAARTLAVLSALREASDPDEHRDSLADLVVELTESGMDYYFLRALKLAKAGFLVE
ncbi:MAG: hypothetical protein IPI44_21745 [Sulfuritalea sp.]|nr:hypothetical protein [Sulfuritalea sp.]